MNESRRLNLFQRFLVFQTTIATFFLRPFAFGAEYPMLGLVALFIPAFLLFVSLPHNNNGILKVACLLFLFYFIDTIVIYATGAGGETAITKFGYVIIGFMLFCNKSVMYTYFKYFKSIILLLVIFALITFVLEISFTDNQLLIKELVLGQYDFSLYLPFSLTSGRWSIESAAISMLIGTHIRNNFFLIEPGMVPPFFTALILMIYSSPNEKHKTRQIVILIVGIFLTFSTAGPLILLASAAVYYFLRSYQNNQLTVRAVLVGIVLFVLAYLLFEYMPSFGRQAKSELSSAQAASMETHQNVALYVQIGFVINVVCALFCSRLKTNYSLYLAIATALCIGYLSNYIAFTFIFTCFLLFGENKTRRINNATFQNSKIIQYDKSVPHDV